MSTGRVSVERAREGLRRKRLEREGRWEPREPLEVAWEREQARTGRQASDVEQVAGRAAGGLVAGALLASWLDLSFASLLAVLVTTMIAWAALGWFIDCLEGERPSR